MNYSKMVLVAFTEEEYQRIVKESEAFKLSTPVWVRRVIVEYISAGGSDGDN